MACHRIGPDSYINREMSWLAFNHRVLMEAYHADNPLLEQARFVGIALHNLDEFFMVRVASLREAMRLGAPEKDPAGFLPDAQLAAIYVRVAEMYAQTDEALHALLPRLAGHGITLTPAAKLGALSRQALLAKLPKAQLTPQPMDILVPGKQVCLLIVSKAKKGKTYSLLPLPQRLPRVLQIQDDPSAWVLIEDALSRSLPQIFPELKITACHPFRLLRGMQSMVEGGEEDLLHSMEVSLAARKRGEVTQLLLPKGMPPECVNVLMHQWQVAPACVFRTAHPLQMDDVIDAMGRYAQYDELRYPPFHSRKLWRKGESPFDKIREGDAFLHHPYDSFDAVVRFTREAARDPRVVAIQQVLYRVSSSSPIIQALEEAAKAGKQVTVLLEVKARFDEANNIQWGKRLLKAGCRVLYGVKGYKTHAKITLVVRREAEGVRRYVHLGTGNYHDKTAAVYTDMGIFTADPAIGEDAEVFFRMLCGETELPPLKSLISAPVRLRDRIEERISREAQNARDGLPSGITAKMNSLVDPALIDALYEASCAGVPIQLIVRGICCLQPGISGLSENITVRSIVGRFLEHSRIFRFENGGAPCTYLSSADWMPRNLDRRVELMFPVKDASIVAEVERVLRLQLSDNRKAWALLADGRWERVPEGEPRVSAQLALLPEQTSAE